MVYEYTDADAPEVPCRKTGHETRGKDSCLLRVPSGSSPWASSASAASKLFHSLLGPEMRGGT